ncbi:MAG: adenosine deaminase [Candidatus Midichloriaceae bacterium]|jgi:adenosine deaminase
MTSNLLNNLTILTSNMIDELPICDIHVHLPGVMSPYTAWELGVRNNFINVAKDLEGSYVYSNGKNSLSISDPHEHYLDIFKRDFVLDESGKPKNLKYNLDYESFKSFDRIMATIQGHRHPPGGIRTEDDLLFVLHNYLEECISQNIFYTELQQNIKIAYLVFPKEEEKDAREKLYLLFEGVVRKFESKGVYLRFLHCFNKTKAAGEAKSTHHRTLEAAQWLKEANNIAPGVFVGLESAGHEKDESGWPVHLKAGYEKVKDLGLGCEAHGGEGIGVEHMMDVLDTLPITRLAHGFQVLEDGEAIKKTIDSGVTLIMMPIINLNLGLCLHVKKPETEPEDFVPCSKSNGGSKIHIRELWQHPFFELFRKHKLKITLSSDNPCIGGVDIKESIKRLSGINSLFPNQVTPLKAEELAVLCINGINAIFGNEDIKIEYMNVLSKWINKNNLNTEFIENYYSK